MPRSNPLRAERAGDPETEWSPEVLPEGAPTPSTDEDDDLDEPVEEAIARLGPWFHNLHLPSGHQTRPDHPLGDSPSSEWAQLAGALPKNLSGWTVLDIGCNAGFYSLALAERGAEVLAVDHDLDYLAQARWAALQFGLEDKIEHRCLDVYDLGELDTEFDLVLFMGVFHHLRYPLLGLDLAAEKVGRLMVFQTLSLPGAEVVDRVEDLPVGGRERLLAPGWPKMAFIEDRLAGDATHWWIPNHAAALAMLRSAGLRVIGQPGHGLYLCERAG